MRAFAYVAGRSLGYTLWIFGGLFLLYTTIDFTEASSMGTGDGAAAYCFCKLLNLGAQILPIALVLGCVLNVALMKKHGELEALLAAGLSSRRIILWVLSVTLPLAGLAYSTLTVLSPACMGRAPSCGAPHVTTAEGSLESYWFKDEQGFKKCFRGQVVRVATTRPDGSLGLMRGDDGHATQYQWSDEEGWGQGEAGIQLCDEMPPMGASGAVSSLAVLDNSEIVRQTALWRQRGIATSSLESELSMRFALVLACLFLPWVGVLVSVRQRSPKPVAFFVTLALACSIGYGVIVVIAWNLSVLGALPAVWIALMAPLLVVLFGVGFKVKTGVTPS